MNACPFCGEENALVLTQETIAKFWNGTYLFVECYGCGAHGPLELSIKQANCSWNKRVLTHEVEQLARLPE